MDRHGNYQYKAFGVPGLGLKRGLGDELVVAPYATALAAMVDPERAAQELPAPGPGRAGRAPTASTRPSTTPTARPTEASGQRAPRPAPRGTVVRAFLAHHQGMSLVALANALLGDAMVQRFHADPRVQATALLLQERAPRHAPDHPAAAGRGDAGGGAGRRGGASAASGRRTRAIPHAQFLSNGTYTAVVTNAGGGASLCRGRAVTRYREDATRDLGSQFLYLRDVRSGSVWSATYHPTGREPEEYLVTFQAEQAVVPPP